MGRYNSPILHAPFDLQYNATMQTSRDINDKFSVVQHRKGAMWEVMASKTNRTVARYSEELDLFTWVGNVSEHEKEFLEAWVKENCKRL
jgi:hypothetical protein